MRMMLLAAAGALGVLALWAAPAAAESGTVGGRSIGPLVGRPAPVSPFAHDGVRRHRNASADVLLNWYGGEWALYNNRSFAPDSYNDWWHDRPDRAYPAWMRRNQDCARPWYSGDVLRC